MAIGFFAGGTQFALRTGDLRRGVVFSYLSIYGPGGHVLAVPLVPRAGVPDTLSCALSAGTTTVSLDAKVAASTNPAIAKGAILHLLIVSGVSGRSVTITNATTGVVLYTLTPSVAPQTFRIAIYPASGG